MTNYELLSMMVQIVFGIILQLFYKILVRQHLVIELCIG